MTDNSKLPVVEARWLPLDMVPRHGRRIYALDRRGRATIIYANPELDRSPYAGWWPLPDHGRAEAEKAEGRNR